MAPDHLLVATAQWGATAVLAWIAGAVAVAALSRSARCRGPATTLLRAYPAWVRRLAHGAVAASVAAVALTPSAADAAGSHPRPRVAAAPTADPLDWPALAAAARTVASPPAAPTASTPSRSPFRVVRPGETLWSIAADALGRRATAAAVAAAWPQWWAANRTAIGPDPDLIRPGERLARPAAPTGRTYR